MVTDSIPSIEGFRHGGELFQFTLKEPDPSVEVRHDSPLYFALDKAYEATGESVVDLLDNIHQHIA